MTGRGWDPKAWDPADADGWVDDWASPDPWADGHRPMHDGTAPQLAPHMMAAAAGGAVGATVLGLIVLLIGGAALALIVGAMVLLGACVVGSEYLRGAR